MTTIMNMLKPKIREISKSEGKRSYDYSLANISICCTILYVKGNIMNKHVQKDHLQRDLNFELDFFYVCMLFVVKYKGTV